MSTNHPTQKKINVAQFMASFSSAGHNLGCDKQSTGLASRLAAPPSPRITVDQWNGREWEQKRLVWDGTSYVPEVQS